MSLNKSDIDCKIVDATDGTKSLDELLTLSAADTIALIFSPYGVIKGGEVISTRSRKWVWNGESADYTEFVANVGVGDTLQLNANVIVPIVRKEVPNGASGVVFVYILTTEGQERYIFTQSGSLWKYNSKSVIDYLRKEDANFLPSVLDYNEYTFTEKVTPEVKNESATIRGIKGNTVVWNQMIDTDTTILDLVANHKYITNIDGAINLQSPTSAITINVVADTDKVTDLTQMFGAGNEPTTVEEFYAKKPIGVDENAYNEGEIIDGNYVGIKATNVDNNTSSTCDLSWLKIYFPNGMRSAGSARDEIRFNSTTQKWEAVQKVDVVDLGSFSWSYIEAYGFYVPAPSNMVVGNLNYLIEKTYTRYANPDRITWISLDNAITNGFNAIGTSWVRNIVIKDSVFTDASTFKSAMSGIMLYYELAEPVVTEIAYLDTSFKAFEGGTEMLLTDSASTPITAEIAYDYDAIQKIESINNALKDDSRPVYNAANIAQNLDDIRIGDPFGQAISAVTSLGTIVSIVNLSSQTTATVMVFFEGRFYRYLIDKTNNNINVAQTEALTFTTA